MSANHYSTLAQIDVSKYVEKKQNLSYLSWPFAVDQLMRHDPMANWVFNDPIMFGETMMVSCTVTAFGKPITMHLPVMDHRNQAIKNPNAFEVNKNMMRCLVKAIACHGLGIHIYAGEDLPLEELPPKAEKSAPVNVNKAPAKEAATPTKMEGREGAWQLTVTADPGADISTWAELVVETCKIALEQTHSGDDVKAIFKVNRNIFDRMKADAQKHYDELMAIFKDKKASFGETA
jgi:hypothetical protein